jgi:hypothetical protein
MKEGEIKVSGEQKKGQQKGQTTEQQQFGQPQEQKKGQTTGQQQFGQPQEQKGQTSGQQQFGQPHEQKGQTTGQEQEREREKVQQREQQKGFSPEQQQQVGQQQFGKPYGQQQEIEREKVQQREQQKGFSPEQQQQVGQHQVGQPYGQQETERVQQRGFSPQQQVGQHQVGQPYGQQYQEQFKGKQTGEAKEIQKEQAERLKEQQRIEQKEQPTEQLKELKRDIHTGESFEQSVPSELKEPLSTMTSPPINLVDEGRVNYGLYNGPIKNLQGIESNIPLLKNFRLKKWEIHSVNNDKWILKMSLFDSGYSSEISCCFYEKDTNNKYEFTVGNVVNIKYTFKYEENGDRTISWNSGDEYLIMNYFFSSNVYAIEVRLPLTSKTSGKAVPLVGKFTMKKSNEKCEELVLVFPLSPENPAYTHKPPPLSICEGHLSFGERDLTAELKRSLVITDFTHSHETRTSTWKSSALVSRLSNGKIIEINCSSRDRFLDRENFIVIDDKLMMIGFVDFDEISENRWKIYNHGEDVRMELNFTSMDNKTIDKNYGIVKYKINQSIGLYSGQIQFKNGENLQVENIFGLFESNYSLW